MSRGFVFLGLMVALLSGCATPGLGDGTATEAAPSQPSRIAQFGHGASATFRICSDDHCPQRTPKTLWIAPPPASATQPAAAPTAPPVVTPQPTLITTSAFVRFGTNRGRLDADATRALSALLPDALKAIRIVLTGHADRSGPHAGNEKLAQRRAASVKLFLVDHSVNPSIIEIASGDCCNKNESRVLRKAADRRVTIEITKEQSNAL